MVKLTVICDVCGKEEVTTQYTVLGARNAAEFSARIAPIGWNFHWYGKKITCPKCELPSESTER